MGFPRIPTVCKQFKAGLGIGANEEAQGLQLIEALLKTVAHSPKFRIEGPNTPSHAAGTMPEWTVHRGPHPEDNQLFGQPKWPQLQAAVADYSWLLTRDYGAPSALTLVGDRFQLSQRQRVAVARCSCSDSSRIQRSQRQAHWSEISEVHIDGLNLLTTVEAALAGGVVLQARDGCYRDMASFHGNYRMVEEALAAAELVGEVLDGRSAHWLLDRPVSNTGRLAALLRGLAERRGWSWEVELVPDPDKILKDSNSVVATADSAILDRCPRWTNLARRVVDLRVPGAWFVPLEVS